MQDVQSITLIISQLGLGGIFLWLLMKERSDHKETVKRKDELSDKVLSVFQDNVRATEGLKSALEGNTKIVDSLSKRIDDVVKFKK